jgi:acyl carrier protein
MSDIKERIINIVADVLEVNEQGREILRDDDEQHTLGEWTSARHAEIIVALEDEFDTEVEERMIAKLNDVPKMIEYFRRAA